MHGLSRFHEFDDPMRRRIENISLFFLHSFFILWILCSFNVRVLYAWLNFNVVARARAHARTFDPIEWSREAKTLVQTFFMWLFSAMRAAAQRTTIQIEWLTYYVCASRVSSVLFFWCEQQFHFEYEIFQMRPLLLCTFLLITCTLDFTWIDAAMKNR